ncbi:hypothetical protein ACFEMC_10920 [Kineococcus sp. DHX-1]|uniref:hypothetical protein n=1 Tax=Kineococcus sp. DHX-1 TaxID=3349638 RepID=UPI0036D3D266
MSMHLLLEGSDLGDLLAEVRTQHGPAARVVRAERIRSGGVAGFFSKERYEVTVEMDGAGGDDETHVSHADDQAPAAGPAPEGLQVEEREALDFEALLAAADAAETAAGAAPAPVPTPAPVVADDTVAAEDFESARAGLLEVLRASQQGASTEAPQTGLKESAADAEDRGVIAQTGDDQHAASTGFAHPDEAADQADEAYAALAADLADELADEQLDEQVDDLADSGADEQADELTDEEAAVAAFEAELLEQARAEIERAELERAEVERVAREREATARAAAERALEEERMQQLEMERREAERAEHARREAVREQEVRREAVRADVRRRQAERVSAPRPQAQVPVRVPAQAPARSLGEVLAAADAADGTDRLGAMFAAGQGEAAPQQRAARPHRPISTESDSFARTLASMRQGATRTPATGVTGDVRSVTTPVRSVRPRPGHPDARPARTPEERVSDQFGTTNGATREGRGPARRPELRRPAAVEDQFADQFGDQFGDRFEVERPVERPVDRAADRGDRRGDWAHDYDQLEQQVAAQSYYEQDSYEKGFEPGYERQDERPARSYQPAPRAAERVERATDRAVNRDGDDNEAMTMDLTYREPVTTYSDRSGASRMAYREPQDTGDVLRLARDIDVPAPLRVGAGELVVVIGEADAVVAAALLVADEVGSEAPLVLGRADVQNTVTADELPARQDQARRWSAPLTVAIPARPTGADAERAARMAAEIGAASVVVCVDATRRSHAVASLLRALDGVGLPARRLAVHRAAESPDPLDVLSLDVPVGFLDGRPATSGAWAGLLLDAAGDHNLR